MHQTRSPLAAFVLAGVAAVTAAVTWIIGSVEAREFAATCNQHYSLLADLAPCRMPALYGAISWVLVTGAIASGWVGAVRRSRSSAQSGGAQRKAGDQAAAVARQQVERAGMGARHALNDR
jgi:hypothetical protein